MYCSLLLLTPLQKVELFVGFVEHPLISQNIKVQRSNPIAVDLHMYVYILYIYIYIYNNFFYIHNVCVCACAVFPGVWHLRPAWNLGTW